MVYTYTHISRETFSSVAGQFADNLEVVELGLEYHLYHYHHYHHHHHHLEPRQELLAGGHEAGVELEEVANQLPQLLEVNG